MPRFAATPSTAVVSPPPPPPLPPLPDDELRALLAQLDSADEKAQLVEQSIQLVRDLERPLMGLFCVTTGTGEGTSQLDAVPELVLTFYQSARTWMISDVPTILSAFAALVHHSQRLRPWPVLKAAFWHCVLASAMTHYVSSGVYKSTLRDAAFPAFVIDFTGSCTTDRAALPPGIASREANDAVADALVGFMTTASHAPKPLIPAASIGFKFEEYGVALSSLDVIEQFLDRTFASPNRVFSVNMLWFSQRSTDINNVTVFARIIEQSVRAYGVHELRLNGVPRNVYGRFPSVFLTIARAVYGLDSLPALTGTSSSSTTPTNALPLQLHKVAIVGSNVTLEYFAMRYSALRYGTTLTSDRTTYESMVYYDHPNIHNYWRWMAFGLFYPQPRCFARRTTTLRNIGHLWHNAAIVETIQKTLRNPASELLYNGLNESGGSEVEPTATLMVVTVKAGASIEIVNTGSLLTTDETTRVETLAARCELEAIYERSDGSAVCVVVPGVGLGWVTAEWIEWIEREPLSRDRTEHDGRYDVELGWAFGPTYNVGFGSAAQAHYDSLRALVATLGRQFRSLSFCDSSSVQRVVPAIRTHCTSLERLDLVNQRISTANCMALLDALDGPLGDRLLALSLNCTDDMGSRPLARLFAMLSDSKRSLALRELRLRFPVLTTKRFVALHEVLAQNRTLALVECKTSSRPYPLTQPIEQQRLIDTFDGQLLQVALSRDAKRALLSVAAHSIDRHALASIFAFAGEHEVRRTLLWDDDESVQRR